MPYAPRVPHVTEKGYSFPTLLADMSTIAHNQIQSTIAGASLVFDNITEPTILQQKALDRLCVSLICTQ
ncbi:hypothetical protein [Microcoleus sp. N3A4]|uniref:hypothetical protein n=1 Tax=Microcoleus sp. N3A4 TaxID=3055379 RepID=UPI002FD62F03